VMANVRSVGMRLWTLFGYATRGARGNSHTRT